MWIHNTVRLLMHEQPFFLLLTPLQPFNSRFENTRFNNFKNKKQEEKISFPLIFWLIFGGSIYSLDREKVINYIQRAPGTNYNVWRINLIIVLIRKNAF
jgi:hypothetical protein